MSAVGSPVEKMRRWKCDKNGILVGFNFKEARADIVARLNIGHVYNLEECRVLLRQILRQATSRAQNEFAELMYLNQWGQKNGVEEPSLDLEEMSNWKLRLDDVVEEVEIATRTPDSPEDNLFNTLRSVNESLVRVIDSVNELRRRRLLLISTILCTWDEAGHFNE